MDKELDEACQKIREYGKVEGFIYVAVKLLEASEIERNKMPDERKDGFVVLEELARNLLDQNDVILLKLRK